MPASEPLPVRLRRVVPADVRLWTQVALHRYQASRSPKPRVAAGVKALGQPDADVGTDPPDDPIFVMSAGWRSGSTLLQRVINSSGSTLVWGEPLQECGPLSRLSQMLLAFDPSAGRLQRTYLGDVSATNARELAHSWSATLSPLPADLLEAQRHFLRRLFAHPAEKAGFGRWGVKETIVGGDGARHLKLLFPRSRIVFLVRNPLDAWLSYRPWITEPWFTAWPDGAVDSPKSFGRLWAELADSFLAFLADGDALLLKYEDLHDRQALLRLADHCGLGLDLDLDAMQERVGSSSQQWFKYPRSTLPRWERGVLRRTCGSVAAKLGYEL